MSAAPPSPPTNVRFGSQHYPEAQIPQFWYRCHRQQYSASAFNPSEVGNARFSPLVTNSRVVPTLYVAETIEAALMETLLRDMVTPSRENVVALDDLLRQDYVVSRLFFQPRCSVIDLTSLGLRAMGVPPALTTCEAAHYTITRLWAECLYTNDPSAHGLLWMSRQLNEAKVAVLFGDRGVQVEAVAGPWPVDDAHVKDRLLSLLRRLGCAVVS